MTQTVIRRIAFITENRNLISQFLEWELERSYTQSLSLISFYENPSLRLDLFLSRFKHEVLVQESRNEKSSVGRMLKKEK